MSRGSLSGDQRRYVASAEIGDSALRAALSGAVAGTLGPDLVGRRVDIELGDDVAEALGDALTEQLATVGFDEDYRVTAEGELIETIIDALAARSR